MPVTQLADIIQKDIGLQLPDHAGDEEMRQQLAAFLNQLINTDFQKLVFLLYRIDINESRLKSLLREHPDENAGLLIAELVIEREKQKIESRKQFRAGDANDTEEKW